MVKINKITEQGHVARICTYMGEDKESSLTSFVITYILKRTNDLMNKELRQEVQSRLRKGRGTYIYYANGKDCYGDVYVAI